MSIFVIFSLCSLENKEPVSQIQSLHLHVGALGIFSDLLRSVQMLKREWSAERNEKLSHLFIPSKTAILVPEFALEDLPLDRTENLVPAFAVKDLPLNRTLWWWWWLLKFIFVNYCCIYNGIVVILIYCISGVANICTYYTPNLFKTGNIWIFQYLTRDVIIIK